MVSSDFTGTRLRTHLSIKKRTANIGWRPRITRQTPRVAGMNFLASRATGLQVPEIPTLLLVAHPFRSGAVI